MIGIPGNSLESIASKKTLSPLSKISSSIYKHLYPENLFCSVKMLLTQSCLQERTILYNLWITVFTNKFLARQTKLRCENFKTIKIYIYIYMKTTYILPLLWTKLSGCFLKRQQIIFSWDIKECCCLPKTSISLFRVKAVKRKLSFHFISAFIYLKLFNIKNNIIIN